MRTRVRPPTMACGTLASPRGKLRVSLDATYDFDFQADVLAGFLGALHIRDTDLCVHDLGGPLGLANPTPPKKTRQKQPSSRPHQA